MRVIRFDRFGPSREQRRAFDSGVASLDRWLATQAGQSMESRDAVTYLLVDAGDADAPIAGYLCISAGQITRDVAPPSMGRQAPDPIPAIRMGRLAIDRRYQAQGWGAELLRHALLAAVAAGDAIGARLMLVEALDVPARGFYLRHGFVASPIDPLRLVIDLRVVAASARPDGDT